MSRSRRGKFKSYKSFVMLPRKMLREEKWKNLSPAAKILYIYIKGKYNGQNNGNIRLYYSELKTVRGLSSSSTISKAFKVLEDEEFIKKTKLGGLFRYFCEYELTGKYDDYL